MSNLIRNKYQIVREIARSNDIVYEATNIQQNQRIAIKELNISPTLTGQDRRNRIERFQREARATGRLKHSNIVTVYEYFEENGRYFIAMEYLSGQTLRDVMQVRGAFSVSEALNIAYQLLDALGYAHKQKVIHRDIKPDNIFLINNSQVKLADFGIARLTEEVALTQDGQVFGTPSYVSPEQIQGSNIDNRSDLFSVAVLLYELLAGRKPFSGDSVVAITYAIMNADPPPLMGLSLSLENVIRKALSKSPHLRHHSAELMKVDLQSAERMPSTGRTGMGNGIPAYPPQSQSTIGTYNPPGNYAPPMPQPPMMPPQQMPPVQGGQPWTWNNQNTGATIPPQARPSIMPASLPTGNGFPATNASGMYPYAAPPFPAPNQEPLFVLSPSGKMFLISLLVSIGIGVGTAFAIFSVQNSYGNFKKNATTNQIVTLMNEGEKAYNQGNFAKSVEVYEKAVAQAIDLEQQKTCRKNLKYSYVQLARASKTKGDFQKAEECYRKALKHDPLYEDTNKELGELLAHNGKANEAKNYEPLSPKDLGTTPTTLSTSTNTTSPNIGNINDPNANVDPNAFLNDRRNQAKQLLQEAAKLAQAGNISDARAKWMEVIQLAPGTDESARANEYLSNTSRSPGWDEGGNPQ